MIRGGFGQIIDIQYNLPPVTLVSGVDIRLFQTVIPAYQPSCTGYAVHAVLQHTSGSTSTSVKPGTGAGGAALPANTVTTVQSVDWKLIASKAIVNANNTIISGTVSAALCYNNVTSGQQTFSVTNRLVVLFVNAASSVDQITPLLWIVTAIR